GQDLELVIVLADKDNFSGAMIRELIETLRAAPFSSQLVISGKNRLPINRTLGVSFSRGDYIVMWDDDVRLVGPVIEKMVRSLEDHPDLGLVSVPSYSDTLKIHRPGSYQLKYPVNDELVLTTRVSGMVMAARGDLVRIAGFGTVWNNFGEDEYLPVQMHRMGFLNAFICAPDAYAVDDNVSTRRISTASTSLTNVLINEALFAYYEPLNAADEFRQGLTIGRLQQYGGRHGRAEDIKAFWEEFRSGVVRFMNGEIGSLDAVLEYAGKNEWSRIRSDNVQFALEYFQRDRQAIEAFRVGEYQRAGFADVNPFLGPFVYTKAPMVDSGTSLRTSPGVELVLKKAVKRLERVMHALNPGAEIKAIKVMPSSYTRGLMIRNSDFDNLVVYVKGIKKEEIPELSSLLFKWLTVPWLRLIDDYENLPLLIPVEDLEGQERIYGIDDMPMVTVYENGKFRPRRKLAEETALLCSMLFEKNVTRAKMFLARGDLDPQWVRSLLKHEAPDSYYYREIMGILDDIDSFRLSPDALKLVEALDNVFLDNEVRPTVPNTNWQYKVPDEERAGVERAIIELCEKGLVRFEKGQLRILWRMIGARWSDVVWNRWRIAVSAVGPGGETIDIIGPLAERASKGRPPIPGNVLVSAMKSANPHLAERAMRQASAEAGAPEILEALLTGLGRKDIIVNAAAQDAIRRHLDSYEPGLKAKLIEDMSSKDILSYYSPVRKRALFIANILFAAAMEQPERVDEVVEFLYENIVLFQEAAPEKVPDRMAQDLLRSFAAVYTDILSLELREKIHAFFERSAESRIVRRSRIAKDILKKIDTPKRGHVVEREGPGGSIVLDAASSEDIGYKNYFTKGVFEPDNDILASIVKGRQVTVILDEAIYDRYHDKIERYFADHHIASCAIYRGKTSEENKSIDSVFEIIDKAMEDKRDRKAVFVAVGGGTLTDVVGLAAQLYRRKIDYVRVPTTLLGIIDAAIGVKVGVNYRGHKNFIGAFYPPYAVVSDTSFLETLDSRQLSSGMGEMLKMAIVSDRDLFGDIERFGDKLIANIPFPEKDDIIRRAARGELRHIQHDFYEKNLRREVDFGHTFAHFIEDASGYALLHGEAVALDILITSHIAMTRGILRREVFDRIVRSAEALKLPFYHDSLTAEKMMEGVERAKAHKGGSLMMVMPKDIGKVMFTDDITGDELAGALYYLKTVNDMPVNARMFTANLTTILTEHPEKIFFVGVEDDLGALNKAQMMPVYKALIEIENLKDADGKKLFPNLIIKREKGTRLKEIVLDLKEQGRLELNHTFLCVRKENVNAYNDLRGEGRAWLSAIDDSGTNVYLPVFESVLLEMMAYLNADTEAIRRIYNDISKEPADDARIQEMLRNKILYITPKVTAYDPEELRLLYERVCQIYTAA
ncbi:MAG: iron-containing alcohol dehydrogenase, partial [Candidatus Omnitrophica bacterium]|nr:iron-containing alcohol dehydrogenase [Candidatus Omnitrophota bacterium]